MPHSVDNTGKPASFQRETGAVDLEQEGGGRQEERDAAIGI